MTYDPKNTSYGAGCLAVHLGRRAANLSVHVRAAVLARQQLQRRSL